MSSHSLDIFVFRSSFWMPLVMCFIDSKKFRSLPRNKYVGKSLETMIMGFSQNMFTGHNPAGIYHSIVSTVFTSAPLPLVLAEGAADTVFTSAPPPLVIAEAAAAAVFADARPACASIRGSDSHTSCSFSALLSEQTTCPIPTEYVSNTRTGSYIGHLFDEFEFNIAMPKHKTTILATTVARVGL